MPISVISVVSRKFERLNKEILLESILKTYFNLRRHGFALNRSTFTNLYRCYYNVTKALDIGDCYYMIFINFQKHFDNIDHNIRIS